MTQRVLTRVTPAEVTRLTTLEQLKAEMGVTTTDNDELYGRVIDYCSNEISVWLAGATDEVGDITIGRETLSETFYEACGRKELILGRRPIGAVTSITEDGVETPRVIEGEINPAFNFVVKNAASLIWKKSGSKLVQFSSSIITVVYSAGWILPGEEGRNLPWAIEDACLRFCRVKVDQVSEGEDLAGPLQGASIDGVGNFQFGTRSGSVGRGLPYEVRNLLERYKTPTLV